MLVWGCVEVWVWVCVCRFVGVAECETHDLVHVYLKEPTVAHNHEQTATKLVDVGRSLDIKRATT